MGTYEIGTYRVGTYGISTYGIGTYRVGTYGIGSYKMGIGKWVSMESVPITLKDKKIKDMQNIKCFQKYFQNWLQQ